MHSHPNSVLLMGDCCRSSTVQSEFSSISISIKIEASDQDRVTSGLTSDHGLGVTGYSSLVVESGVTSWQLQLVGQRLFSKPTASRSSYGSCGSSFSDGT